LIVGVSLTAAGMIKFHSLRKILGIEVSKLVTTGIIQLEQKPSVFGIVPRIFGHFASRTVGICTTTYKRYKLRTPRYIKII